MKTETATHAKTHFGEVLNIAIREPVLIKKSGKNTAVLLSYEEYERMVALEDSYWVNKAREAEKEGFMGAEAGEQLLEEIFKEK